MRWAACCALLLFGLVLLGCGDSGSPPATASAGGGPPVPGGPPAGPPAPGGDAPPAGETPPAAESPPAAETPPPQEAQPAPTSPGGEGGQPPGDPNNGNPNPGDDPNNPDAPPRRPPPPRTLKDQSYAMFRMGNDVAGMKLLNAHYAVVPAAKQELAQKMGWYPGLMRPALAPRIGIGIHVVEQPINFKGDPMPIGSKSLTTVVDQMQQKQASDSAIGHTGRMSKFGRGRHGAVLDYSERAKVDQTQNLPGEAQVSYYLGDFGEWFIEALHDRMETGEYGPVLQDLMKNATRPPAARRDPNDPNAQPGDGASDFAGGQFGGDGSGAPPFPGGGAGGRGRGGRGGAGRGGAGGGFPGGGPGGGGPGGGAPGGGRGFAGGGLPGAGADVGGKNQASRWSAKGDNKDNVDVSTVKQISPCLLWLGKFKEDEREDLTKVAEAMDIDILAVFSLTLKQARTGTLLNNKSILRLVNMRTGKPVAEYSPEPIVNLDVEKWRQKDEKGTDPVEREVLKMLDAVDKVLKPTPLPEAVTAERAKKRIDSLVAAKPEEPLPVLVEARYYFAKGLLGPDEFAETAKTLLGEEGFAKLASRAKAPIDE